MSTASLPRAAIYVRISKDREGRELGVERQENDCRALAERMGYQATVFRDNDISASTLSNKVRPSFDDMMRRVEGGEFAAIISYSNSRLTRRVVELSRLIDVCKATRVRIHTVVSGQHDLDTADGRASMLTIAVWDQAEAERAGERIRREKSERAIKGEWHGGTPPYGYRAENKKLILVDSEAENIREASKRLLDDREPMHSIVTDWNRPSSPGGSDIRNPTRNGKHWRQSNLKHILLNRSLLGETKAGVVGWEPVIDRRTFDRLGVLLNDPSRKVVQSPGVKGGKYTMGGGLAICGLCGKPLITSIKKGRDGSNTVAVACLKRVNGSHPAHRPVLNEATGKWQDTNRVSVKHDLLETYVFDQVLASLNDLDRWRQRMAENDPAADKEIDRLETERAALRDQRERAGKSYVLGLLSQHDAQAEVARLDSELEALERQINDLLGRPPVDLNVEGAVDWQDWTSGRRRAFLKMLIHSVVIGPWPEESKRTSPRWRGESEEDYIARRDRDALAVLEKRVQIIWRWERE